MATTPPYLNPFVLPVATRSRERHDRIDLYLPDHAPEPAPAVVFVHGGPVPVDLTPTPREWPVFVGYASAVAGRGAVAATVDHRLHGFDDYPVAASDVAAAVEQVRRDPRVDADRVAVWFFSGGGLLLADWLRSPQPWLRCVAATYPLLGVPPGVEFDSRFLPAQALSDAGALPIVLTTVGRERPNLAAAVVEFVAAAQEVGANLQIIEVPDGEHSFDCGPATEQAQAAVESALDAVLALLS